MSEVKKVNKLYETKTVDHESGEIKTEETVKVSTIGREPDYIKLYLDDLTKLNNLPSSSSSVLFSILKRMGYNNEVVLIQPIKNDICLETELKIDTVNKRISELKTKGILLQREKTRSIYLVNPYYCGKGKWEDIRKVRLSLEYTKDGRKISAEFDKQQDLLNEFFTEGKEENKTK